MAHIKNESSIPLHLYVVHLDDVGKRPITEARWAVRVTLQPGETLTLAEFRTALDDNACSFRAALVSKHGAAVLHDPRSFAGMSDDDRYDRFNEGYTSCMEGEPFDMAESTEWQDGWRECDSKS